MADPEALRDLLGAARSGGTQVCEAAVTAGLISDWEMSRIVAEMFQLPFLPVDICRPDPSLWGEVGSEGFRESAVVPMRRFGRLLTIAMPGLVSAEVLRALAEETGCDLLPMVGTVQTNRRWIEEQTRPEPGGTQRGRRVTARDGGGAAVQASLDVREELEPPSLVDREVPGEPTQDSEASPLNLPPSPRG